MSRTPGLDDIPLDVFRGVVAFGMGRFTVGRLNKHGRNPSNYGDSTAY